jgi:HlyD family secretion protein
MSLFFSNRWLYILIAIIIISGVLVMMFNLGGNKELNLVTTEVELGSVRQLVSVSGIAEADQSADLAFPTTGVVEQVLVRSGDMVEAGDVLVTLESRALYADRQEALAAIASAEANRNELIAGPTTEARTVTTETVTTKRLSLETVRQNETEKVNNTYRALLSNDLTAYSVDSNEDAPPPIVSGTYECANEGSYRIELYSSASDSGYSYRLSGLESGTFGASVEQPGPMGVCGLELQFAANARYDRAVYTIDVPNTRSNTYITYQNAYDLAVTQAEGAISSAEQSLVLAEADAEKQNAPARTESIERATAAITQARARLSRIDASIADRQLTAPFSGIITDIDILPGETVTTAPIIVLLADSAFEVTARIPEIDIGKLLIGQQVEMVFDARPTELITGEIRFISLKATEIDGVAYYEAIITPNEAPAWMRSGLNADIEIIITEQTDVLRIPRRFLRETETGFEVLKPAMREGDTWTAPVEVILEGNDGYVAITGINEGDIVVAP